MKVVITDYQYDNVDQERRIVTDAGFTFETFQVKEPADVIPVVEDADAVVTQYSTIDKDVIAAMKNCKVIIKYGIGINNIDAAAATEKGIYVCNVPDYGIDEVSNHAVAFIMALAKKLPLINAACKAGEWNYDSVQPLFRMAGQTLGLMGFGRIPQMVATKMRPFNMDIIVYDPYISAEVCEEHGVKSVDFDTLVKESDYISLHSPLTEETEHLFNDDVFKTMKDTAFLINTARGAIIDEKALINALNAGDIAGAALDVFEAEPVAKDNPLLAMDNVIATPHAAWYSEEAIDTLQEKVALEVVNILQGGVPFNLCNKEVLNTK